MPQQKGKPDGDNTVRVGWKDGQFTLVKDQAVMASSAGSAIHWQIRNRTGDDGNGKAIDVELLNAPGNQSNGNNILDLHNRTLNLAIPGTTTRQVYDYVFKVSDHADTSVTRTFSADDPWIVVF